MRSADAMSTECNGNGIEARHSTAQHSTAQQWSSHLLTELCKAGEHCSPALHSRLQHDDVFKGPSGGRCAVLVGLKGGSHGRGQLAQHLSAHPVCMNSAEQGIHNACMQNASAHLPQQKGSFTVGRTNFLSSATHRCWTKRAGQNSL